MFRVILVLICQSHPDIYNHIDWGQRFLQLKPSNFYENNIWSVSWPNQPFGSILLFALIAFLRNSIFNFLFFLNVKIPAFPSFIIPILDKNLHIWLVKLPFILSDLGITYLVYKVVNKINPKKSLLAASLFIFNPIVIYNSAIWGQTDSLINLLSILGLYLTYRKKYFLGIILFLSSYLFKLSLFIYIPIFFILLIKQIKDYKKFILPFLLFSVFIIIIALSFSGDKNPIEWLWYMYNNKVFTRQGNMLNGNAFNIWFLFFGVDFSRSEFGKFGIFTYQTWSRILYIIYLIPIFWKFFKSKISLSNILYTSLLTAFGAFIFMTNMHERYLYPIFPSLIILIFISKKLFSVRSLICLTLIHLLNLYNLWFYPLIDYVKNILIFQNFLVGKILSLILIIIFSLFTYRYLRYEIPEK